MKKATILLIFLAALQTNMQAQDYCGRRSNVLDGVALSSQSRFKAAFDYTYLREADAAYVKRIWRKIDLRQKLNHPLYFPLEPKSGNRSLFDALICAITVKRTVTAYSTGDLGDSDDFTIEMSASEVEEGMNQQLEVPFENLSTGQMELDTITVRIESKDVVHYIVKEEQFFDKQRSVMETRIIGIAPVIAVYDTETGDFKGYKILFWVYYPEAREMLASEPAFNRFNDAERRTYDEIFQKRMFGSVIIKESNVYERSISEYRKGLNALLEAEHIQNRLTNIEMDVWRW